jgi:hypothetical protein
MPLSFPRLERDDQGRWYAHCRTCGWTSTPIAVKASADYSRRLHGPEKECTRAVTS